MKEANAKATANDGARKQLQIQVCPSPRWCSLSRLFFCYVVCRNFVSSVCKDCPFSILSASGFLPPPLSSFNYAFSFQVEEVTRELEEHKSRSAAAVAQIESLRDQVFSSLLLLCFMILVMFFVEICQSAVFL